MKNRVGSLFAEASFDKFMKYFYDALMWLSVLAMFWAFSTQYRPSDIAIYVSIIASIILSMFLVYQIEKERTDYQEKVKRLNRAPKFLFYGCLFVGYYCLSAYILCYGVHSISAENTPRAVYVVPVGETGRKIAYCATTVRVIDMEAFLKHSYKAEKIDYCLSEQQYRDILKVYSDGPSEKAKVFMAQYKTSIFGIEFVEANRINDVIK